MKGKIGSLIFTLAIIAFGGLFAGRTNVYCSLLMFFLGLFFLASFVYAMGIKGAMPLVWIKVPKEKKGFYYKCGWAAGLAGLIMSAVAFWILNFPLSVWLPVMFLPLAFSGIIYPPMFYEEKADSYEDKSFGYLFLLSLGMAFAMMCVLAGAHFHGINMG